MGSSLVGQEPRAAASAHPVPRRPERGRRSPEAAPPPPDNLLFFPLYHKDAIFSVL